MIASLLTDIVTVVPNAGRVDVHPVTGALAVDRRGDDGYYDVWLCDGYGQGLVNLTAGLAGFTPRNVGNPAWHPSGHWLLVQAQKDLGQDAGATPGAGLNNDLYAVHPNGSAYYLLHSITQGECLIHPHFSADGTKVCFAHRHSPPGGGDLIGGAWDIHVADFVVAGGVPSLANMQTFQPNGGVFHEAHGFTVDGTAIVFSGVPAGGEAWNMGGWRLLLADGTAAALVPAGADWGEHFHLSRAEDLLVWMTSRGQSWTKGSGAAAVATLRTEVWIARGDGTGLEQLTHFNDAGYPESTGVKTVVGDMAWHADGRSIYARVDYAGAREDLVRLQIGVERMADRNDGVPGAHGVSRRWVDLGAGVYAPAVAVLAAAPDTLVSDATANDSDKTFTVPASTIWEPLFVAVTFVTTATVGNRKMRMEIGDGAALWWYKEWAPLQVASQTRVYFAALGLPDDAAFDAVGRARILLEPRFPLPAGWTVRLYDVNAIDATADDMTVKILGDTRSG